MCEIIPLLSPSTDGNMQSQIIVIASSVTSITASSAISSTASRKEGKTMMFNDPIDTIDPQLLLKQIHYKEEFILSGATLEDLRKRIPGSSPTGF